MLKNIRNHWKPYLKSYLVSFGVGVTFTITVTVALIGLKRLVWVSQPPKLSYGEEVVPKLETDQKTLRHIYQIKQDIEEEKRRVEEYQEQLRKRFQIFAKTYDKEEFKNAFSILRNHTLLKP